MSGRDPSWGDVIVNAITPNVCACEHAPPQQRLLSFSAPPSRAATESRSRRTRVLLVGALLCCINLLLFLCIPRATVRCSTQKNGWCGSWPGIPPTAQREPRPARGCLTLQDASTLSERYDHHDEAVTFLPLSLSHHDNWLQVSLNLSLRHEVARLIVWRVVRTRPVVPSAVSYADVREGNAPYSACEHGTHSHPTGT